jgi:macrodomain Ter protein organizer (MatP/YcbG family)
MNDKLRILQRQPRRISITLSYNVHEALIKRSDEEGRSVSNLCAFLLEDALKDQRDLIGIHSRDNIVDGLAGKKLMLNGDSVSNGFSRRP